VAASTMGGVAPYPRTAVRALAGRCRRAIWQALAHSRRTAIREHEALPDRAVLAAGTPWMAGKPGAGRVGKQQGQQRASASADDRVDAGLVQGVPDPSPDRSDTSRSGDSPPASTDHPLEIAHDLKNSLN